MTSEPQLIRGRVRFYDHGRNLGSISAGGQFFFIDSSSLLKSKARQLREGTNVVFKASHGKGVQIAQEITLDN
jgi:cold shock CspA family protein